MQTRDHKGTNDYITRLTFAAGEPTCVFHNTSKQVVGEPGTAHGDRFYEPQCIDVIFVEETRGRRGDERN